MTFSIRHQKWTETITHIVLRLREPFWSAWQRYGFERGVEGYGLGVEALALAREKGKKIKIVVKKYGTYEFNPTDIMMERYGKNTFTARDHKRLLVIPRTACTPLRRAIKTV